MILRRYKLEILLVGTIVVVTAVFIRWEYIPTYADRHVDIAQQKYGFDMGDPGEWFSAWSLGDGQAYAMIAVDPSGQQLAGHVSEAGYRFARAGYGWAVWAASFGQESKVPYALAMVGAVSLVGVLALAVRERPALGPRAWLMVLNPALFIGFAGDTSEPLGIFFLAGAMAWGSPVMAALLGITRPTFLVALWRDRRLFLVGVAAAVALAAYSLVAFGASTLVRAGGRLGIPLAGYLQHQSVWGFLLLLAASVTLVVGWRRRDWVWILAGLFVTCFGADVLRDSVNAWRAAGFLPVMWAFGPGFEIRADFGGLRKVKADTAIDQST